MAISNWAGNVVFTPTDVLRARDIAEAQQLVANAPRIRALGTGHSFNDIADAPQLISLQDVASPFELDETARTVTVPGAAPYGAVAAFLQEHGWALHNLGSLPHISVAGATATATHGSGDRNGVLSTAVRGIERIGADGELTWVRAGEPDFNGSVVALGALGVITRITLAIEPTYDMTQQVYTGLRWDTFLDEFDEIMGAAYSVSVLGRWGGPTLSTLWLKNRALTPQAETADAAPQLFGGDRVTAEVHAIITGDAPDDNMTPLGTRGAWSTRLAHFRYDRAPSAGGDEIQSEFFVPRAVAVDALQAIRPLGERIDPLLHVSEFRTFAGDDLWLSGGEGGGRVAIHFTWKQRPAEVAAILPEIEAALRPFTPRSHWGKVYSDGFDQAAGFHRLSDFAALAARVDPEGKFRNHHLDRVLTISGSEAP
ncbi:FAD-binding protein [Microbacterium murale]|uniref:Xylitol oxidase n=1 Tax=Microbacterium murale TaxID=1081040 RepID=A0ABU0PAD1_9MICO|nr:FAD-binding protein [Microbacterium murale]MDQ0644297.1 xylitol oxidase [Microbacterium murale]